ncbi:MAG TPA: ABC transporter permease [Bryobacteraceae bacterium]|nr:ABC transporter permease [Bryobacteraceae bacterium]
MEWFRDLRLGLRLLKKSPGTTALSVASIALGIGLTTGVFAAGAAVLIRNLPIDKPLEVWRVRSRGDDGNIISYGWPDYLDMSAALRGRAEVIATQRRSVTVGQGDGAELAILQPASSNFFRVAGAKAELGRPSIGESGGTPEAVLGYRLWKTHFAGDPNIVGKTISLNGRPFLVAAVMPRGFAGLDYGISIGVWVSADAWFQQIGSRDEEASRSGQFDIAVRFPASAGEISETGRDAATLDAAIRGPGKRPPAPAGVPGTMLDCVSRPWLNHLVLGGGMAAVLFLVVFVACINVAQLRLAQAEARRKELGIRIALGGGRWRVARQFLIETSLLGAAGAGLGLWVAQTLIDKIADFARSAQPLLDFNVRIDYRVLAYAAGSLALSILVAGVGPALHAVRLNVSDVLKQAQGVTAGRRTWRQKTLVVSQVAVSVALIGVSALFLTSLYHATRIRPGLDPRKNVLVLNVIPARRAPPAEWCDQISERLAALPGARGATYARRLPLAGSGGGLTARVEPAGLAPMGVPMNNVGGNYFAVMGTRVLEGRGIDAGDRPGSPSVAVVSQTLARTVFGARDPIGQWLRIDGRPRQIVGISEDGPSNNLHQSSEPFVFLPYAQAPSGDITLMVETAAEPSALDRLARAEVRRFDPGARIYMSTTLRQTLDAALSPDNLLAALSSAMGFSVALLTAAGLFGVLLYAVNGRTRELGLRVALGANSKQIKQLVIADSLRMAAIGVPIGLVGLAAAARLLRSVLFGVGPLEPISYTVSVAGALVLALAAAWLPARRATRIDPMEALRAE